MLEIRNRVIQGLWVDGPLSAMEQLSIRSFLQHGHEFHLYTYKGVSNAPPGTMVMDGNEILPASAIFRYRDNNSYAGFANFFRYKLLLEKGGWWVDLDTVCLQPFCWPHGYVFGSEQDRNHSFVCSAVIRVPAHSAFAEHCWKVCQSRNPADLRWGETGPRLVAEAVSRFKLQQYVQPPQTFCPVPYREWKRLLEPGSISDFGSDTFAIHLWQEMWRSNNKDKDQRYSPECLYEKLREKYLGV